MEFSLIGSFAGGIGLFLLGMGLMTDGLKSAAGPALRRILGEWTRTPARGLFSGLLITALVHSSSAVTVATIGFVNAGVLTLAQTIGVIYGSNIGSTMTGWLVAMIGFKLEIKALALPLIGLGMVLRLTGGAGRRRPLGMALAGFGLFFLGIDVLKSAFSDIGPSIPMDDLSDRGFIGVLIFVGVGFLLTLLMQSSAAAMALTLTAAASGLIPLTQAAATVVGANLGTTSTAALAVIGATPNAKRMAAAHVLFNVITGAVALVILAPMLDFVAFGRDLLDLEQNPVTTLALFHTVFNLLGVLLLWPFSGALVRFLEGRFRSSEEDLARVRFLDSNILGTPALALDAVALELARVGAMARAMGRAALSGGVKDGRFTVERNAVERLTLTIDEFAVELQRADLSREVSGLLPEAMRVSRYYRDVADAAADMGTEEKKLEEVSEPKLVEAMAEVRSAAVSLLDHADPERAEFDPVQCAGDLEQLERRYQRLKGLLLRAGTDERVKVHQMVAQLDFYSRVRRMAAQVVKGANYLHGIRRRTHREAEITDPVPDLPPEAEPEQA